MKDPSLCVLQFFDGERVSLGQHALGATVSIGAVFVFKIDGVLTGITRDVDARRA